MWFHIYGENLMDQHQTLICFPNGEVLLTNEDNTRMFKTLRMKLQEVIII